jgi:hypothetical protein
MIEIVVDLSNNEIDIDVCEGRDGIVVKVSYNSMVFDRGMNSGYKHA